MSVSLQADSTLPQGYILVDGQRVASVSTTGGLSATLAANTVTTSSLVSGSVTTEKIAPGAVTAAKMAGGQSGDAPVYGCRAWVNFSGTLSAGGVNSSALNNPVFIRSSGNVASVVKLNQAGDYIINFTQPMINNNYSVCVTSGFNSGSGPYAGINRYSTSTPLSTNACRIYHWNNNSAWADAEFICVQIFG